MSDMERELTNKAIQAYRMFRGSDPVETAKDVAYAVGPHAFRLGLSREDLVRWLQSAYSGVWVRESGLNPGLDLKDVRKALLYAYDKSAARARRGSLVARVASLHLGKGDLDIQKHLDKFGLDWTYDLRTQSYHVNGGARSGGFTFTHSEDGWVFNGPRAGGDVLESSFDVWKTISQQRMASGSSAKVRQQAYDLLHDLEYQMQERSAPSRRLQSKIESLLVQAEDALTGDLMEDISWSAIYNALDYMDSVSVLWRKPREVSKAIESARRELDTAR